MRQVADAPVSPGQPQLGAVDLVVRTLEEPLEHPQLVENLHCRRMDRVATEIAEEVRMLFENSDLAARAGEQQPCHHSGRAAPYDDQVSVAFRRHAASALQPEDWFENAVTESKPPAL